MTNLKENERLVYDATLKKDLDACFWFRDSSF